MLLCKCFIKFQTSLLVKCSTLLLFKTILIKIMGYRVLSITTRKLRHRKNMNMQGYERNGEVNAT